MANPLNLFPSRVPIGSANGVPVYVTPEFSRALADVFSRIGGANGMSNDELSVEIAASSAIGAVLVLTQAVADLQAELAGARATVAAFAELKKQVEALELQNVGVTPGIDWERPGKIGATTPNSGKFTTLEATNAVKINPANQPVDIKPTGTAVVTIQSAQPGQLDNMELGKLAPRPARVSSLNKIAISEVATSATLTLADGAILTVPGAGGTLGSAAYQDAANFAGRTNTGLGPPATDAASTQNLANNLRTVLLAVGIGT